MHIGHTIIQDDVGEGGSTVLLSSWFPREADNAIFSYEEIKLENTTFEVKVFHKNTEETGKGTENTTGTFSEVGSTDVFTGRFTALEELIRFQYEAKDGSWPDTPPCFVIYRMLAPTWYNTEIA